MSGACDFCGGSGWVTSLLLPPDKPIVSTAIHTYTKGDRDMNCLHCSAKVTGGETLAYGHTRCGGCDAKLRRELGADRMPPVNPKTGKFVGGKTAEYHSRDFVRDLRQSVRTTIRVHEHIAYGHAADHWDDVDNYAA